MNQTEFNRQAEIDALHAELQVNTCKILNKYGASDENINDLLRVMFRMEKFITDQK